MRYLAAILLSFFLAGPALSSQCPSLAQKIDDQLASADLDRTARKQVEGLRDEGMALHKAGQHAESVQVLKRALEKLDSARD